MHGCRLGLVAALVFAPLLVTGCDDPESTMMVAETFAEGVARDSEDGAFRVVLSSEDGLGVGENTLIVRLGFHDPHDPSAPGLGIPGARVVLDAWMPHGTGELTGLHGVHLGDGHYAIELALPAPGVWQLDFDLAVGDAVSDSVSFAFLVGG